MERIMRVLMPGGTLKRMLITTDMSSGTRCVSV
jgi:hypothetical protein